MDAVRPERLEQRDLPIDLGRYTLQGVLGEGGMARVFRATLHGPAGFTKAVALKVVRRDALDEGARQQLISEARIGGLLNHVNVVNTFDLGEIAGTLVIAMELVEGVTAHQLLVGSQGLHPGSVLQIGAQACRGLAHAHSLVAGGRPIHLVHRDLKPGNLMITRDGVVKVADFGIAVAQGITEGHQVAGTPAYMSPEQVSGDPLSPRSDLFTMGTVLATLAFGKSPFRRQVAAASVMAILDVERTVRRNRVVEKLDAWAPGLGAVVARCLQADPADRWPDALSLASALEALIAEVGSGPPLRDLVRQVRGPDEDQTASRAEPTLRLLDATNLIGDEDRFVGRRSELAEIGQRFADHAVVTISGPGGTGKTRLARAWAMANLQPFHDSGGAWFVDAAGSSDARELLGAVIRVVSIDPDGADLAAEARSVGRAMAAAGPMLLVLDNLEQVADAAADFVRTWTEAAPELRVLATSRQRLKVDGEAVVVLEPLPIDDAVALFIARADERAPGQLPRSQHKLVRTLVERLEGVPLALELVAAQLQKTQLHRLVRRGGTDVLRSAIDWSWELLSPAERDTLAQLSIFVDGFTVQDAEAVVDLGNHLDAPWAVFTIEALVDKSLVRVHTVPELPRTRRFSLFESIRRYAAHKLRTEGAVAAAHGAVLSGPTAHADAQRRHLRHFARLGDPRGLADAHRHGGDARWQALRQELGNLRAAARAGLALGLGDEAAAAGAAAAHVLHGTGEVVAAVHLVERLLEVELSDPAQLRLVLQQGQLLRRRGLLEASGHALLKAGALARRCDDAAARIDVWTELGLLRMTQGDLSEARSYLERARAAAALVDDPARLGSVLDAAAEVALREGDRTRALQDAEAALQLQQQVGNRGEEGSVRLLLTNLLHRAGHGEAALEHGQAALILFQRLGDRRREGNACAHLAEIHLDAGRAGHALEAWERALRLHRQTGDRNSEAATVMNLAVLHHIQGDLVQARDLYQQAIALQREQGARWFEASTLGNLGELELETQNLEDACQHLDRAIAMLKELGAEGSHEGYYRAVRAHARALRGDTAGAAADIEAASALTAATADLHTRAKVLARAGFVACAGDDRPGARIWLDQADTLARQLHVGADSELAMLVADLAAAVDEER